MFDRTFVSTPAPEVHIHNETKPHDAADAARLYGQLREKAEAEVADATIERFGAHNEIRVVATESRFMTDQVRVLFTINDVKFDFAIDRASIAAKFYSIAAAAIAGELTKQFLRLK